jgi:hypothetical protein
MNLSFTRAAFLDDALEELSVVLENRLVGGRFWLPSTQSIEIKRKGEWLDYPIRGIIQGRWEVGDYRFNLGLAPTLFVGPEIVQAPPEQLRAHVFTGRILDSLPPGVRALSDPDIERVQAEARRLVQARALERAQGLRLSARNISDFVRFNRVEGLALGGGVARTFSGGISANVRSRYGFKDGQPKGAVTFSSTKSNGVSVRLFGSRDFRDVGDVAERSVPVNSLAAQEFASDYTDPYLARAVGLGVDFPLVASFQSRFTGSYEHQSPLSVNATPVRGTFLPTVLASDRHLTRLALELDRPTKLAFLGTELTIHGELRSSILASRESLENASSTYRGAAQLRLERPFGRFRLATATTVAGVHIANDSGPVVDMAQDLVYLGGPVSAPGYPFHSIVTDAAATEHIEFRAPVPFIPFSLGRFGRVPSQGTFALYGHAVFANQFQQGFVIPSGGGIIPDPGRPTGSPDNFYPSVGAAYILPFDIVRIDVARGLGHGGRWTFNIDVSREFWPIL